MNGRRVSTIRVLVLFTAASILIVGAPSTSRTQATAQEEVITPFWTLDWTFDTGNLSGEYAIDRIRWLHIGSDGELIIVDSDDIKVFDRYGNPLLILRDATGSPVVPSSLMGPVGRTGYLMVIENVIERGLWAIGHQFGPGFSYLGTREFPHTPPWDDLASERGLTLRSNPFSIVSFSEHEHVFQVNGAETRRRRRDGPGQQWEVLIHEKDGTYEVIGAWEQPDTIPTGDNTSLGLPAMFGALQYRALPGRRIVYTHTAHDRDVEGGLSRYILHILSLEDGTVTDITHTYAPEPLTVGELLDIAQRISRSSFDLDDPANRERIRPFEEAVEAHPFKAPISQLLTDREYIFARTVSSDSAGGSLTQVLDADRVRYLRSSYIPQPAYEYWRLAAIRNGYAYGVLDWRGADGPPRIERYRVNPAIYRK